MRTTSYEQLDSMFLDRWSPRAFSDDQLTQEQIHALFEAARWSPSCFNAQPWRFVYATQGTDAFNPFVDVLAEGNQVWARHAPLLVYAFSYNVFDHNGKPNRWAEFDTGAAWMALTLQANKMGLHTHAMGGFDTEGAYEICNVDSNTHTALCAIAVGKMGDKGKLPDDIAEREVPSDRNDLNSMAFKNSMRS